MKNIFSVTLGVICILLIALLSGVFIHINLQVQQAREYHAAIIERVQSSYYSPYIIQDCITAGKKHGYQVKIDNTGVYEDIKEYYVSLDYSISIPLLQTKMNGNIEGYAR